MFQWFRDRIDIIRLSFRNAPVLRVFTLLQIAFLLLKLLAVTSPASWVRPLAAIPWWVWALGWLTVLWSTTLDHAVGRKKHFDETSLNFFRAYLDFITQAGHNLFHLSDEKDFYFKIKEWQRQAVLGIAIGLGPAESERFFHKMEAKNPLQEAYKKSRDLGNPEPLCRVLQDHLGELAEMRKSLPEAKGKIGNGSTALATWNGPDDRRPDAAQDRKQLPPG